MRCAICEKPNATYKCSNCGVWFCVKCAENQCFECDCLPQPRIILATDLKKGRKK